MKSKILSFPVILISILSINAQTYFGEQNILIQSETSMATDVYATDIDGDGDLDVLSASSGDDKIAWYENTDGLGTLGIQKVITHSADAAESVYATDIDGDGDQDVLSASYGSGQIAWYENVDGEGTFGMQQVITSEAAWARSVYATDIDGDGDQDVLSASEHDAKVAWYENADGTGTFGPQQIISDTLFGACSVYASDIDGDGDQDILSTSRMSGRLAWYENTNGLGSFSEHQVVAMGTSGAEAVYSADIDGDGDQDILSADRSQIVWYENEDGVGHFGTQQVISTQTWYAESICVADIDGDGDQDVLSASHADDEIAWYENTDGEGTFGTQQLISDSADWAMAVYAADIDGDGDQDVLSASLNDHKIAWYENTDGLGAFSGQQLVTRKTDGASWVHAADVDGDGYQDILSASDHANEIAWYKNSDGAGTFETQVVITTSAHNASCVHATDIDGDGDQDILSASRDDNKIAWYENTDGAGTFGLQQIVTTEAEWAMSVYATDIDGDGDQDILSASLRDDKIAWYENTDGEGTFGLQRIITNGADGAHSVYSADIDGDGDQDVLSASFNEHEIAWYENTNGLGAFGLAKIVTTDAVLATSVYAKDIDGDGDKDILSASSYDDKIAWYENIDGNGTFGAQQVVTLDADNVECVYAVDIDRDGDQDILSASSYDDKIAWYENIDGEGTFGSQQVITTMAKGACSAYAFDIDRDGDMDILSASISDDKIAWYENLTPPTYDEVVSRAYSWGSSVYPNPTTGRLMFDFTSRRPERLMLTDVTGKLLLDKVKLEPQSSLDISEFERGTYIATILIGDEVFISKVIKE